jgi:hypothetical protein
MPIFFPCFFGSKRNNSTGRHVVSMENPMRQWLGSIKPASHELTERSTALGRVVFNMRDYPRI